MGKGTPASSVVKLKSIRAALLGWYDVSRRDLPWRRTTDPYRIWVSEMMLQQTRVAAVLEHYRKFLLKFPDVHTLASAKEAEVLTAWSGLGYYRRARAMHAAAKVVVQEFSGGFPAGVEELERLPGIGRYTAAAISSIAFGKDVAVVDGNVERVLTRFLGARLSGRNEAWVRAETLLDRERPGDWNQAMMELGATVCLPSEPQCLICPIQNWCKDPGRDVKKAQAPRRRKELLYGLAKRRDSLYLVQRASTDSLMAGMWELPTLREGNGNAVVHRARHSITNNDYAVTVVSLSPREANGGRWVRCSKVGELPVTGLTRKILKATNLWPSDGI